LTEDNEKNGEQLEEPGVVPEPGQAELGAEETVGEMLLAAREKKGLTLEAISQETKVPVATLRHLETDNFEAIPAKVYATGFLRTYARVLGLDPTQIINKYEVQTGQTHKSRGDLWEIEEEVVEEKLDSPHLLRKFVIPAITLVVVIIILWKIFGGDDGDRGDSGTRPGTGRQAAGESAAKTGEQGETAPGTDMDAGQPETEVGEADKPGSGQAAPAAVKPEPPAERPEPGIMSLRILAEERTWFDLAVYNRTASGIDTLETDFILEPGESRTFTSNEYFFIKKIGNTEGFTIELDGRPYEVPIVEGRLPRDIRISRGR
jgi:cytoskeleton protein RodZ